jgi:hypothetical protein
MPTPAVQPYRHTPIFCGIDYITATEKHGAFEGRFERIADSYLQQKRDAGGDVRQASRLGYRGHQTEHFFFGRRPEDDVLIVSGREASPLAKSIIDAASNVSRLDLNVTVWTHGEQCNLAVENYRRLCASRRAAHRQGRISLTTSKPDGDTLYVNKRTTDHFGRLYDKAAEASIAPPGTVWSYEIEVKRRCAMACATAASASGSIPSYTRDYVHQWWTAKGINPTFTTSDFPLNERHHIEEPTRDVLTWFEKSVSITVAKAINRHGLARTLSALGLDRLVQPISEGGDSFGR